MFTQWWNTLWKIIWLVHGEMFYTYDAILQKFVFFLKIIYTISEAEDKVNTNTFVHSYVHSYHIFTYMLINILLYNYSIYIT